MNQLVFPLPAAADDGAPDVQVDSSFRVGEDRRRLKTSSRSGVTKVCTGEDTTGIPSSLLRSQRATSSSSGTTSNSRPGLVAVWTGQRRERREVLLTYKQNLLTEIAALEQSEEHSDQTHTVRDPLIAQM